MDQPAGTAPVLPAPVADARGLRAAGSRRRIGWITAGALAAGPVAAALFAAAPFVRPQESELTGAVLCGLGTGWAILAVLSVRFTDQPQRWAFAPAAFLGANGLLLVVFGSPVHNVLNWVWPLAALALVVWMAIRTRRRLPSRIGRWLLYPVFALLTVASISAGYETVAEAADDAAHPMTGELIDVGGHRLHLSCTGSGGPTVVLEPGAGEMSADMGWIAPAVASSSRVCVYDRAGRGGSQPANSPQDGIQIATDLHTLLHNANVPGPYVLAGHSFGGMYVQTFAALFPGEVAGMVLIDSTAPKPGTAARSDGDSYDLLGRVTALLSTAARFGLGRLYGQLDYGTLPPASRDEARASVARAGQLRSTMDEYVAGNASMQQAGALTGFADKPLVVLTAGVGNAPGWDGKQDAMAALSTNSAHRVVDGATHGVLVTEEKYAAIAARGILDVLASVRSGVPLGE